MSKMPIFDHSGHVLALRPDPNCPACRDWDKRLETTPNPMPRRVVFPLRNVAIAVLVVAALALGWGAISARGLDFGGCKSSDTRAHHGWSVNVCGQPGHLTWAEDRRGKDVRRVDVVGHYADTVPQTLWFSATITVGPGAGTYTLPAGLPACMPIQIDVYPANEPHNADTLLGGPRSTVPGPCATSTSTTTSPTSTTTPTETTTTTTTSPSSTTTTPPTSTSTTTSPSSTTITPPTTTSTTTTQTTSGTSSTATQSGGTTFPTNTGDGGSSASTPAPAAPTSPELPYTGSNPWPLGLLGVVLLGLGGFAVKAGSKGRYQS